MTSGPLTARRPRGNGVYAYGSTSAVPDQYVRGDEFLGRRDVQPVHRHRQSAAGRRRRQRSGHEHATPPSRSRPRPCSPTTRDPERRRADHHRRRAQRATAPSPSTPRRNIHHLHADAGYTGAGGFSYAISDGRGGTASANVSLTVAPPGPAPVEPVHQRPTRRRRRLTTASRLEVGMKFQSSAAGQITALKFYRSASDTGPDILDLWSATGTKLAQRDLHATRRRAAGRPSSSPTPVPIAANTTYVASLPHDRRLCGDRQLLHRCRDQRAADGARRSGSGGNGVYGYGGQRACFPTNSFGGGNYWVDVVYNPPTSTNRNPRSPAPIPPQRPSTRP